MQSFSAPERFGARVDKGSNSYANGANQNCGNVITDRPTSRVLAPPGGGSSFSLGWNTSENPRSLGNANNSRKENQPLEIYRHVQNEQTNTRYARGCGVRNTSTISFGDYKDTFTSDQMPHNTQGQNQQSRMLHGQKYQQECHSKHVQSTTRYEGGRGNRSNSSTLSFGDYKDTFPNDLRPRNVNGSTGCEAESNKQDYGSSGSATFQQASHQQFQTGNFTFGGRVAKGSNGYANGANQNVGNYITDRPTSRVLAPPGGLSSFSLG